MDEDRFDAIVAHQCSDDVRLDHADDVIYNNGDMASLQAEVEMLHNKLLRQFDGVI